MPAACGNRILQTIVKRVFCASPNERFDLIESQRIKLQGKKNDDPDL